MSQSDQDKKLEPALWDGAHRIARAFISAIPLIGGPATELFAELFTPPLEKRRDEWLQYCLDGLKKQEEQFEDFSIEGLAQNESFISIFVQATRIAISNHQAEKRTVLRNAVLNATSQTCPDDDLQHIFVAMIDDLTPWHLRILAAVNKSWGWPQEEGNQQYSLPNPFFAGKVQLIEEAFPELKGQEDFYDLLLRDLANRGLLVVTREGPKFEGKTYFRMGPTPIGMQFRKFISSPFCE